MKKTNVVLWSVQGLLAIIMIGATGLTLATGGAAQAIVPLVVSLLSAFVAYGRWELTPYRGSSYASTLRHAE